MSLNGANSLFRPFILLHHLGVLGVLCGYATTLRLDPPCMTSCHRGHRDHREMRLLPGAFPACSETIRQIAALI